MSSRPAEHDLGEGRLPTHAAIDPSSLRITPGPVREPELCRCQLANVKHGVKPHGGIILPLHVVSDAVFTSSGHHGDELYSSLAAFAIPCTFGSLQLPSPTHHGSVQYVASHRMTRHLFWSDGPPGPVHQLAREQSIAIPAARTPRGTGLLPQTQTPNASHATVVSPPVRMPVILEQSTGGVPPHDAPSHGGCGVQNEPSHSGSYPNDPRLLYPPPNCAKLIMSPERSLLPTGLLFVYWYDDHVASTRGSTWR